MSGEVYYRVPAKVILLGEHFVVHGTRAVSAAVDLFVEGKAKRINDPKIVLHYLDHVESLDYRADDPIVRYVKYIISKLDIGDYPYIEVRFGFPTSAGLGSSASLAYLLISLIDKLYGYGLDRDELFNIAEEFERMIHGNPSGVDLTTVVNKGFILYRRGIGVLDRIDRDVFDGFELILIDSKVRRSTGLIVSRVTQYLKELDEDVRNEFLRVVDKMVGDGWKSLLNSDIKNFIDVIDSNHYLLKYIGIYNQRLDEIVSIFHKLGVRGVKVTGAGGGGCVMAIVDRGVKDKIVKKFRLLGYPVYNPKIYF